MSEAQAAIQEGGPSIKDRLWAAGDAVAGMATRGAAVLIPLGLAAAAATGLIHMGVESAEIIRGVAGVVGTATLVTSAMAATYAGFKAFKDPSKERQAGFDKSLEDAKFIGGVTAAGAAVGLGLACVGSGLNAAFPQMHGIGYLLGLPMWAGAAVASLAGAGVGALSAVDPTFGKEKEEPGQASSASDPSEAAPLPSESFSVDRLARRREAQAAAAPAQEPSAPRMA